MKSFKFDWKSKVFFQLTPAPDDSDVWNNTLLNQLEDGGGMSNQLESQVCIGFGTSQLGSRAGMASCGRWSDQFGI